MVPHGGDSKLDFFSWLYPFILILFIGKGEPFIEQKSQYTEINRHVKRRAIGITIRHSHRIGTKSA